MTTVEFTCPVCAHVKADASTFLLVICASDPDRSFYQAPCPSCREIVTRQASPAVADALTGPRVLPPVRVLAFPAEALEPRVGPPLTSDDHLDLILALRTLETTP